MIHPEGIPVEELTLVASALDEHVSELSGLGEPFTDLGNDIHNTFQGLNEVYEAPERELLVNSTLKVKTNLDEFGPSLPAMAGHLATLADEMRGYAGMLESIQEDAYDWQRRKDADPDWQSDQAMVDECNMLVALVGTIMTDRLPEICFTAANEIVKLHGGETWDPETGLREGEEAPAAPADAPEPEDPPWGTSENVDHPWWADTLMFPGNFCQGVLTVLGETLESILTLVPVLPLLGEIDGLRDWAKDTLNYDIPTWEDAGNAWKGLGIFAGQLASAPGQLIAWGAEELLGIERPDWLKEWSQTGVTMGDQMIEGFLAWDEWKENPGKALGMVTTNIVATIFSGGSAGAVRSVALAGRFGAMSTTVARLAGVASKVQGVRITMHDAALAAAMKIPTVSDVISGLSKIPVFGDSFRFEGVEPVDVPVNVPDGTDSTAPTSFNSPDATTDTSSADTSAVDTSAVDSTSVDTSPVDASPVDSSSVVGPPVDTSDVSAPVDSPPVDTSDVTTDRPSIDTPDHTPDADSPPLSQVDPVITPPATHLNPGTTTPGPHVDPSTTPPSSRTPDTPTTPGTRTPSTPSSSTRTPDTTTPRTPDTSRTTDASRTPDTSRGTDTSRAPGTSRGTDRSGTPDTSRGTDTSRTPDTSRGTDTSRAPETTGSPEPSRSPETSRTPETSSSPESTRTPATSRTQESTHSPETPRTPETTRAPETARTPETTRTPETARTPETSRRPETSRTPETVSTPEATRTPGTSRSPEAGTANTPGASRVPEGSSAASGTRSAEGTSPGRDPGVAGNGDPGTPVMPMHPGVPGYVGGAPNVPTTPGRPGTPNQPGAVDAPAARQTPSAGAPRSGDHGQWDSTPPWQRSDPRGPVRGPDANTPAWQRNDPMRPQRQPNTHTDDANDPRWDDPLARQVELDKLKPDYLRPEPGKPRPEVDPFSHIPADPMDPRAGKLIRSVGDPPHSNVAEWMGNVNPDYGTSKPHEMNCPETARNAADILYGGKPRLAAGNKFRTGEQPDSTLEWMDLADFKPEHQMWAHPDLNANPAVFTNAAYRRVFDALVDRPPGTHANIFVTWRSSNPDIPGSGHVFNAFVDETGRVKFLDTQPAGGKLEDAFPDGHLGPDPANPYWSETTLPDGSTRRDPIDITSIRFAVREPGGSWEGVPRTPTTPPASLSQIPRAQSHRVDAPHTPDVIRAGEHPASPGRHPEPELADRSFQASRHDEAEFLRRDPDYQAGRIEQHRRRGRLQPSSAIANLTDVDIRALEKLLTTDHQYINTAYRAGDLRIEHDPTVRLAVSAMNKMPDVSGTVHRGIQIEPEDLAAFMRRYAPGSTVREPAFQHSAKTPDGAFGFNVQLEIDARHGKDLSFLRPGFQEVMHPPHTTFHATEMRYDEANRTLHIKIRDHGGPPEPPPGGWPSLPTVPDVDPRLAAVRKRVQETHPPATPQTPQTPIDPFADRASQYRPDQPGQQPQYRQPGQRPGQPLDEQPRYDPQQPSPPASPEYQPPWQRTAQRPEARPQYGGPPQGQPAGSAGRAVPSARNAGYEVRELPDSEFVSRDSPAAEAAYRRIRDLTDDVPQIAEELELDPAVVDVAKRNLFVNQHHVSVGPGDIVKGNFTADKDIADLWKAGMNGTLNLREGEDNQLRSLIAHEYVEAKLTAAGVPYNFADGWKEGTYDYTRENAGAHTVSPRSLQADLEVLLGHWKSLGLTPPPGGLAPDLSNLDDIVQRAIEGMEW